eukprot:m.7550 g.7550  ORF g.7550 m.7550 type:complete len:222 (+) comp2844_c0_seq1:34-699(+)
MAILTLEHLLRFVFETVTDVALVPSLGIVHARGRHFEFFIGFCQFVTSLCYNVTDSLDVNLFLSGRQWHELTNIFSITYGIHLFIFLMGNRLESRDVFLRYLSFGLVWVAQLKDGYWMVTSQYTVWVAAFFGVLMVAKLVLTSNSTPFDQGILLKGIGGLVVAAIFFFLSLDDAKDPYRLFHGIAQSFVGLALYFLWQAIPRNIYKKTDSYLPNSTAFRLA